MKQALKTPLALAILNLLNERPMHPYEMQQHMRERGHDFVIKLKGGSLYSTIERLIAGGLIHPVETSREGRRPERTVYALTELGQDDLMAWLRELVARPIHEYPWFGAVLAFIGALPPNDVRTLLEFRAAALAAEIAGGETMLQATTAQGLPRLFAIEGEYALAMRRAELAWVRQTVDEIGTGALAWPPEALELHAARAKEKES
ncbi:MAG TPA: PadR family transcriptional regulator [Thermomicrobiales bacterium]|jgi:DNA-binding PadR family transcriptional regulator